MAIERTHYELREILQANFELVRAKQFIPACAPDCGTTAQNAIKSLFASQILIPNQILGLGDSWVKCLPQAETPDWGEIPKDASISR